MQVNRYSAIMNISRRGGMEKMIKMIKSYDMQNRMILEVFHNDVLVFDNRFENKNDLDSTTVEIRWLLRNLGFDEDEIDVLNSL